MATFRPRRLCGWRYPRQRPHCSVELKRIVSERGRRSRGGHLCVVMHLPSSLKKSIPSLLTAPSFLPRLEQTSTIGLVRNSCFFSFRLPPLLLRLESGTSRARMTEPVCRSLYDPEKDFSSFHGSSLTPSGRFPSVLSRPDGSFKVVMSAFAIARHTRSFTQWCLAERPLPPLHDRPCSPFAFEGFFKFKKVCSLSECMPFRSAHKPP